MIGVVFNPKKLERIVYQEEQRENADFYFKLAKEYKVDVLFYSLDGISRQRESVKGYVYSHSNQDFTEQIVSIPKVNLLRTILHETQHYKKLKRIELEQNISFINITEGRDKYKIYQFLKENDHLTDYVPDTIRLSYKNLIQFLQRYNKLIIKPINGAMGEKILTLEKRGELYYVDYIFLRKQYQKVLTSMQLYHFFKRFYKDSSSYLIQQWISFKNYEDGKFDLRISVQKNGKSYWKVTGIVARVAKKNGIVTNIAQGGRAVSYKEIQDSLPPKIKKKIYRLSLDIAKGLEIFNTDTADLGLDIAIDQDDNLWFIEANYCDERYSYRESEDLDMWLASYRTPFEHAYGQYVRQMEILEVKGNKEMGKTIEEETETAYDE
jgi:glutathione synthase/RimK-type ligase-like ATP-grasp enzyme